MGLFAFYMHLFPDGSHRWFLVPLTFIGVVILIVLCQYIWVGGVQPGGVVLCILLFNTPTDTYISYALNRILDTGIGVLAAMFVNGMLPGGFTFGFMHRFYQRVGIKDDVVDEDFRKVKATLIDWIAQRPDDGEYALDLLMIAKYFERIGDHACNIAQWVEYALTGQYEDD